MASTEGTAPPPGADPNDHPDILAFPPAIALGILALSFLLEWLLPLRWPLPAWSRWIALPPFVLSMILVSAARHAMTRAGTNVRPDRPTTAIVSAGPYRFVRNPMYLAITLLLLAFALAARSTWGLVLLAPLFALLHFGVVLREERYLDAKFGDGYRAYRSRVRRWL